MGTKYGPAAPAADWYADDGPQPLHQGEKMSTTYGPSSDFAPRPWLDEADYYKAGELDIRTVIEAFGLNFNEGSILKYVTRRKPGNTRLMDLKKARVHLEREIAREEATAPSLPAAMQAQIHAQAQVAAARQFSNAGMDEARRQQLSSDFSYGEPVRMVPRQLCPADDVTPGEEAGTFISRAPGPLKPL